MVSDEERREVAARMREIMRDNPHGWLDVMVANAVVGVMGDGEKIGETVADLIDRPTCADARRGNDGGRSDDAPDGWERLEGDVRRSLGPMAACSYFGRGMGDGCRGCPSGARGSDCNRAMSGDILRRSEALAGVARQTCRLVPYGDGTGQGTCSECHGALTDRDNFCPDCGREIEVTDD